MPREERIMDEILEWSNFDFPHHCWRKSFEGRKDSTTLRLVPFLYLVFPGRSSSSPCENSLSVRDTALFICSYNLTEQSSANHTSKWRLQDALRLRVSSLHIFFPQERKSFVSTRSYRFVNVRLARTEHDKLQKLQLQVTQQIYRENGDS